MNVLNRDRINELVKHRSPLSVSMFMPTHRTGRARQQDTIRLKNLIKEARDRLLKTSAAAAVADKVVEPASQLRFNESFWRHRGDALACLCSPDVFRAYRLPMKLDEQLYVKDRFHIRPLLPLLRSDARIYVLALSLRSARLFEATMFSMREIELPDIVPPQVDGDEQSLQYHSHHAPAQGKGATETAMYHGQGGPADRGKTDTMRYFQLVDHAVVKMLRGQAAPLVLACVGYLASMYEAANSYEGLFKGKVPGSPERWSTDELRDHAWSLVEPYFRRTQER